MTTGPFIMPFARDACSRFTNFGPKSRARVASSAALAKLRLFAVASARIRVWQLAGNLAATGLQDRSIWNSRAHWESFQALPSRLQLFAVDRRRAHAHEARPQQ